MSKFALCIGINYKGTKNQLMGCASDAERLREHLIKKGFEVVILCDDSKFSNGSPTRKNIVNYIRTLVQNANAVPDSHVIFTYSGHGSSIRDLDGDELDGMDEVIVTVDNEYVTDDEFCEHFIRKLNKNVKLFCMFDSCHSGTMLDLKFKHSNGKNTIENKNVDICSDVVAISGCKDNQCSADAYIGGEIKYSGAMTFAFFHDYKPDISFLDLVKNMRSTLKNAGYPQIPQLTMSKEDLIQQNVGNYV